MEKLIDRINFSVNKDLEIIDTLLRTDKKIGIFGTGYVANVIIYIFRKLGIKIDFVTVNNKYLHISEGETVRKCRLDV